MVSKKDITNTINYILKNYTFKNDKSEFTKFTYVLNITLQNIRFKQTKPYEKRLKNQQQCPNTRKKRTPY